LSADIAYRARMPAKMIFPLDVNGRF